MAGLGSTNCNGYIRHLDDEDSHSICATQNECLRIFDHLKANGVAVGSIDMHVSMSRCFINKAVTTESQVTDANYNHLTMVDYDDLEAEVTASLSARQGRY